MSTPSPHFDRHLADGPDEILGDLNAVARSAIAVGGVLIGTRRGVNFIEGPGIIITPTDQPSTESVDLEFEFDPTVVQQPTTGDVKMGLQTASHGNWLLLAGGSFSGATWPNLQTFLGGTTLPDLRGRGPIGSGTGSGLTARTLKTTGGTETHQLTEAELAVHDHDMAQHSHAMPHTHGLESHKHDIVGGEAFYTSGNNGAFALTLAAAGAPGSTPYKNTILETDTPSTFGTAQQPSTPNTAFAGSGTGQAAINTTNIAGSGSAHNNMQPFYVVNFFIYAA